MRHIRVISAILTVVLTTAVSRDSLFELGFEV